MTTLIKIIEAGNGFPEVGDVLQGTHEEFTIDRFVGDIRTDDNRGNYILAVATGSAFESEEEGEEFFPASVEVVEEDFEEEA